MESTKLFDTLFLDRDGVINRHLPGDYVKSVSEFIFIEGTLEALAILSTLFRHVILVTNQRGVGRGVMNGHDLEDIHNNMMQTILLHGGRIDRIYSCTETDENHPNRKPNPGMIRQAVQDFPDINLTNSWLAGDSLSDMQLASNVGVKGVLIGNRYTAEEIKPIPVYASYKDLFTFAKELQNR